MIHGGSNIYSPTTIPKDLGIRQGNARALYRFQEGIR